MFTLIAYIWLVKSHDFDRWRSGTSRLGAFARVLSLSLCFSFIISAFLLYFSSPPAVNLRVCVCVCGGGSRVERKLLRSLKANIMADVSGMELFHR